MSQTQSDPTPAEARPAAQTAGGGATTTAAGGAGSAGTGTVADDDPLSHLHKMSTTAGLGSGEYVAVNGAAVFALLLGLASALTLLEEVLLVIPITCIIVSVIAWQQIRHSNGTQTGKGLVLIALLCALGFGGFVLAREGTAEIRTRDDRASIRARITELADRIKLGDVAGAYALFSDRFHEQVDLPTFTTRVNMVRESEVLGKLKEAQWNNLAGFESNAATGDPYAYTRFKLVLDKATIDIETRLRKAANGQWQFDDMPTLFPPPNAQPGRQ